MIVHKLNEPKVLQALEAAEVASVSLNRVSFGTSQPVIRSGEKGVDMATFKHPDDISIDPPTLPIFHPDRAIECQDSIAGALTKLIDDAEGMGWHVNEITAAITDLADSIMLQDVDIEETNYILRDILDRRTK